MVDSLWQDIGGSRFPLQSEDIDDTALTFEPADPALDVLADMMAAVIRAELGSGTDAAWTKVCAALPTGHRLLDSTDPVGAVWKIEPSAAAVRTIKPSWPLLAVWRDGSGEWSQWSTMKDLHTQRWSIMWCLGDAEPDTGFKLAPVLQHVAKAIASTILNARHPAYDSGAKQFGIDNGLPSGFRPIDGGAGVAHFIDDEDAKFWAASVTLESSEIVTELDQGSDNARVVITADVGGGDGGLIPELIVADPDHPG